MYLLAVALDLVTAEAREAANPLPCKVTALIFDFPPIRRSHFIKMFMLSVMIILVITCTNVTSTLYKLDTAFLVHVIMNPQMPCFYVNRTNSLTKLPLKLLEYLPL